jgi:hypothetical protein
MRRAALRLLAASAAALLLAGCAHAPPPRYATATGFSFEAHDGSGTYFSATRKFRPEYCGTPYPERDLDIGQANFDRIERLVDSADLWSAQLETIEGCTDIDPYTAFSHFRFDRPGRSLTLEWGKCQRVAGGRGRALAEIARIVRAESDRLTLKVEATCIRM